MQLPRVLQVLGSSCTEAQELEWRRHRSQHAESRRSPSRVQLLSCEKKPIPTQCHLTGFSCVVNYAGNVDRRYHTDSTSPVSRKTNVRAVPARHLTRRSHNNRVTLRRVDGTHTYHSMFPTSLGLWEVLQLAKQYCPFSPALFLSSFFVSTFTRKPDDTSSSHTKTLPRL